MKYTIHTAAMTHKLEAERILTNDVILPWERHPHNMRMWVIWNELGSLCAVWASHEQDAFDEACDRGMLESMLVEDDSELTEQERDEYASLGNAGELHDLQYAGIGVAEWDFDRDRVVLCAMAQARGAVVDTLDKI